jgi:riboflavin synthase alpha subunit
LSHESGRVGSGWVLGHLVSGHFRFHVVLSRVGSVIGLSSVESFRILDRIRSGRLSGHLVLGHFEFWVVSDRVGSVISGVSGRIRSDRLSGHLVSNHFEF